MSRAHDRDAYVYRIVLNERATSRRRRWWQERPTAELPERPTLRDTADLSDLTTTVQAAPGQLSEPHRRVIVLRYYTDLTEAQTAEALGVPVGTVKSRLSRAVAALAADLSLADVPGWSPR